MIAFIRGRGLEQEFRDWSGGGPCPIDSDVLQNDLRDILDALGLPSGAQPRSPYEVFCDALVEVKRLALARDALNNLMRRLDDHYGGPSRIGDWKEQEDARKVLRQ